MALVPATMKKDIEAILISAFTREFKDEVVANPKATDGHKKLAAAISDIANVIVLHLTTLCQVAPGIPVTTAGSPAAQAGTTVGPGKLI